MRLARGYEDFFFSIGFFSLYSYESPNLQYPHWYDSYNPVQTWIRCQLPLKLDRWQRLLGETPRGWTRQNRCASFPLSISGDLNRGRSWSGVEMQGVPPGRKWEGPRETNKKSGVEMLVDKRWRKWWGKEKGQKTVVCKCEIVKWGDSVVGVGEGSRLCKRRVVEYCGLGMNQKKKPLEYVRDIWSRWLEMMVGPTNILNVHFRDVKKGRIIHPQRKVNLWFFKRAKTEIYP